MAPEVVGSVSRSARHAGQVVCRRAIGDGLSGDYELAHAEPRGKTEMRAVKPAALAREMSTVAVRCKRKAAI